VISCHSRDIGVDCLLFCNHYKDHGRDYVQYHDWNGTRVCWFKFDKIVVCGSGGQVFESTSHIPYTVSLVPDWTGKWTYPTTRILVFVAHTHQHVGIRST
jgi:hypothetical protein